MNLKIKVIKEKMDRYNNYIRAIRWDKNIDQKNIGVDWLIKKMVGAYIDEELVGIGCIGKYYEGSKINGDLTVLVNPNHRKKGVEDRLLSYMLNYSKEELKIEKVKATMLKTDLPSVSQYERNDFDFVSFDDKSITFEKKLKKTR